MIYGLKTTELRYLCKWSEMKACKPCCHLPRWLLRNAAPSQEIIAWKPHNHLKTCLWKRNSLNVIRDDGPKTMQPSLEMIIWNKLHHLSKRHQRWRLETHVITSRHNPLKNAAPSLNTRETIACKPHYNLLDGEDLSNYVQCNVILPWTTYTFLFYSFDGPLSSGTSLRGPTALPW